MISCQYQQICLISCHTVCEGILIIDRRSKELRFNLKFRRRITIHKPEGKSWRIHPNKLNTIIACMYSILYKYLYLWCKQWWQRKAFAPGLPFTKTKTTFWKCGPAPPDQCVRPGTANTTAQVTDERRCHHISEVSYLQDSKTSKDTQQSQHAAI